MAKRIAHNYSSMKVEQNPMSKINIYRDVEWMDDMLNDDSDTWEEEKHIEEKPLPLLKDKFSEFREIINERIHNEEIYNDVKESNSGFLFTLERPPLWPSKTDEVFEKDFEKTKEFILEGTSDDDMSLLTEIFIPLMSKFERKIVDVLLRRISRIRDTKTRISLEGYVAGDLSVFLNDDEMPELDLEEPKEYDNREVTNQSLFLSMRDGNPIPFQKHPDKAMLYIRMMSDKNLYDFVQTFNDTLFSKRIVNSLKHRIEKVKDEELKKKIESFFENIQRLSDNEKEIYYQNFYWSLEKFECEKEGWFRRKEEIENGEHNDKSESILPPQPHWDDDSKLLFTEKIEYTYNYFKNVMSDVDITYFIELIPYILKKTGSVEIIDAGLVRTSYVEDEYERHYLQDFFCYMFRYFNGKLEMKFYN